MTKFTDLGLAEPLLAVLNQEGYDSPTPIQAQAIPHGLAGRDILGIAQTGTGKTAAFALPILHRLFDEVVVPTPKSARVLVLAPTRELASQIAESFSVYGRRLRPSVTTVFGGVPVSKQARALAPGVDVLVATPGRLIDLIEQRALNLNAIEVLVLDEADQMMDLGFIHALRKIVALLPRQRQTLFFSATMPPAIRELAGKYLTNPAQVAVAPQATTAERVDQSCYFVDQRDKPALLATVLKKWDHDRVLVFTRTKHGADRVVRQLAANSIDAAAIHGNKSQPQRERALDAFRDGKTRVLVATDIAARGIDVDGVSHVINYELPNVSEQYVHRIGRTARAGADGQAVAFVDGEERAYLTAIERLTKQPIARLKLPDNFTAAAPVGVVEPKRGPKPHRGGGGRQDGPRKPKATHAAQPAGARGGRLGGRGGQGGQRSGGGQAQGSQRSGGAERPTGERPAGASGRGPRSRRDGGSSANA